MNEEENKKIDYIEFSKNMVLKIIQSNEHTAEIVYEIFELQSGNKELLLKHLKAITGIMNKAIQELEKGDSNE